MSDQNFHISSFFPEIKKFVGYLKGSLFNISTYKCDKISINIHIFRDKIVSKRRKDDLKVRVYFSTLGLVHAAYTFPKSHNDYVSFYTFGSGEEKVTIDDVSFLFLIV